MQDLQDVTIRYINCEDPIESAARRQRVIESDSRGLMEETLTFMLCNSPNLQPTRTGQRNSQVIPLEETVAETHHSGNPERELILGKTKKKHGRPPINPLQSKKNQLNEAGPNATVEQHDREDQHRQEAQTQKNQQLHRSSQPLNQSFLLNPELNCYGLGNPITVHRLKELKRNHAADNFPNGNKEH
ncbi:unnamed protein product [Microthlaspi erraticum]|uniref:Uncharacterized protein n=1 Tax=Microthlaspi erraticum TaxID=1685480 RepID=A0A6D2KZH0_9BRAS|nr:unnamed protein product [Microthlaspi erraticum]